MIGLMPVKLDEAISEKKALLKALYEVFEDEVKKYPFVCRPGCADCCTVNVIATGIETILVLDSLGEGEKGKLYSELSPLKAKERLRPKVTPNEMASFYMAGKEPPLDEGFVFEPCPFLDEKNLCRLYEVRPLACRTFFSLKLCREAGEAVVPPEFFSLTMVFMQVLEEIDIAGVYGNFIDLLLFYLEKEKAKPEDLVIPETILANREAPDFAIPPQHEEYVRGVLARLYKHPVGDKTFKELLDAVKARIKPKEALSFLGEALS
ncbi:protein of unknown function UPF0153 [Thermodesulfatator indicus DSM 15286]|uniref:YkgJ family cysteine cluster protein n=1 Tax=Thermodesulfatator indicus (strain DSM 15286 / JCM 11887 / CIR29812) TaxID=667014 RepID=F8A8I2_THEID|nr:YkgJ family cysteine cluster protein [Thermodesulfatator indicus]AEH45068.1 protein of unknown function UPF0153 [Thermodesulfatator indicus DSM 15286]